MLSPIHDWLLQQGFGSQGADLITMSLEVALVIVLAAVADVVAKRIVVRGLETLVGRTEYLDAKRSEITEWNQERNVDAADPLNGRRLTNVGTFRAYVVAYLRHHPMIRQDMTFLVRQLAPTRASRSRSTCSAVTRSGPTMRTFRETSSTTSWPSLPRSIYASTRLRPAAISRMCC